MQRRNFHRWAPLLIAAATAGVVLAIGACFDIGYSCPSGLTRCGMLCPNIRIDRTNCGACGVACQSGQQCVDGVCVCGPGTTPCNGYCVVTSSDPFNCGGCAGDGGVVCAPDQVCDQSSDRGAAMCVSACFSARTRCDPMDGGRAICTDTRLDPNNCGGCGISCDGGRCDGGTCT